MSSERWMPPEMPAPVKKIPLFLVAPRRDQSEGSRTGPWTVRDLKGARVLEASRIPFAWSHFGCPSTSSTQSRRRRPIITGRCPQAAPDAPRATRAAAARSSTAARADSSRRRI